VGRRFDEIIERAEHEAHDDAFRTAFDTGTSATQADLEALLVELAPEMAATPEPPRSAT